VARSIDLDNDADSTDSGVLLESSEIAKRVLLILRKSAFD
jgi:hypothetical protein